MQRAVQYETGKHSVKYTFPSAQLLVKLNAFLTTTSFGILRETHLSTEAIGVLQTSSSIVGIRKLR